MNEISARVETLLGVKVASVTRLGGGDLSAVYLVELDNDCLIAKQTELAEAEAAMLRVLGQTGAPAPEVLAAERGLLLMSRCEGSSGPGSAWASLAHVLNRLWSAAGESYGWQDDYAFGPVALPNRRHRHWPRFWAEQRLLCHLAFLPADLARRIEKFAQAIDDFLPGEPLPSLLHGDLWGGNVMTSDSEVTGLIDPACYYGHREVDLAMLSLFDHPPVRFLEALELDAGWEERQPAYRLFPLIVHFRLFGVSYRGALEADLGTLGF